MNTYLIFILGLIGALAPEAVRLYSIRNEPEKFKWSGFYVVVSMLFAILGGIIAVVLPATTYWGALYVGISSPVLINTVVKKGGEMNKQELKSFPARQVSRYSKFQSFINGL